jgi:ketohexokinase
MQILGIGVATLDIIDSLSDFPREDSEQRAEARWNRRGGNAANTLVVLKQLGHSCSWAGTLAEDAAAVQIVADLQAHEIDLHWARRHPGSSSPVSHILQNRRTASRTIIHYRDLPEYELEDFRFIDLSPFDWLHFEGRHVDACEGMMLLARQVRPQLPLSLEVEKPRIGIERCMPQADLVIFSRAYAVAMGFDTAPALFAHVRSLGVEGRLVAAWGEEGGWLQEAGADPLHLPARPPAKLIDTLAAGDVFNAGLIHALLMGESGPRALALAIELAGRKCGQQGIEGLVGLDV